MKRTLKTATAAAMAGALVLAATPQANAISYDELKVFLQNPPEAFEDEQGNYYVLVNGEYIQKELPATVAERAEAPTLVVREDGTVDLVAGTNALPEDPAAVASVEELEAAEQKRADALAAASAPVRNARCGETIWYRTADGAHYVTDQELVNTKVNPAAETVRTAAEVQTGVESGKCAYVEGLPVAEPEVLTEEQKNDALAIGLGVGAAVAVPLIIGGIAYWLNQDGKTLVPSLDRVNAKPTEEERAQSDRIRAENPEQVAALEAAAAAESRGIAAETGSNTLARTLFGLVIALALGAAAFLAGRRFLV